MDIVDWLAEAGGFTEDDVLGGQAPFYFDLSVKDIYLTLKCGASCQSFSSARPYTSWRTCS